PTSEYSPIVLLIEGRHLEASDGGAGMRRPRACLASTHPGGTGIPSGGQQEPPARSLADGWSVSSWNGQRKARLGAVRRTPANKPGRRELVRVARREAPPCFRKGTRAQRTNGCVTWRAIPLALPRGEKTRRETGLPGASTKNTGDDARLLSETASRRAL